jgi:hypothetical protein
MKITTLLFALGLSILGVQGASAQDEVPTGEATLMDMARIVANTRANQQKFCAAPRNHTQARCNADFDAMFPQMAEYAARQILYRTALDKSAPAQTIKKLRAEWESCKTTTLKMSSQLEKDYFPVKGSAQN